MSLEFNTNIAEMDAADTLTGAERSTSRSIEQLSSDLPIDQPILQQASISMLAHGQKQPQAVLPLLLN